ncbi:SDR family oxidoreductase, partial [Thioclava sp. BHET1]
VEAVTRIEAEFGPIDVLINNAGVIDPIARLEDVDADSWHRNIDINLKGVFNGMHAVLPGMKARGAGTILSVSSGAAHNALEGWSAYCAAKAGAAMLTSCAHVEFASAGLRIMGLSPGTVATEMQVKIRASGINRVSQLTPGDHIP